MIALIMATGLAEGCGLFLLLAAFLPALGSASKPMAIALAALAATRIWTWWRYLNALKSEGAPTRTLEIFTACRVWFFAAGFMLPVTLVAVGMILTVADAASVRARRAFGFRHRLGDKIHSHHARRLQSGLRASPHPHTRLRRTRTGGQAGMDLAMSWCRTVPARKERHRAP